MPDDTTAPVTAEPCCDAHLQWLCDDRGIEAPGPCCPNCPTNLDAPPSDLPTSFTVGSNDLRKLVAWAVLEFHGRELAPTETELALAEGTADAVIAELAGYQGDMPKLMADELRAHYPADREASRCACGEQEVFDWAVHQVEALMPIRSEHAAHMAARIAVAEAEVERLQEELEAAHDERDAARLVSKGRTMEQYDLEAAVRSVREVAEYFLHEHEGGVDPCASAVLAALPSRRLAQATTEETNDG